MDFKLKNPKTPSIKSIFERVEIENGCYFENSGTTPNVLPLDLKDCGYEDKILGSFNTIKLRNDVIYIRNNYGVFSKNINSTKGFDHVDQTQGIFMDNTYYKAGINSDFYLVGNDIGIDDKRFLVDTATGTINKNSIASSPPTGNPALLINSDLDFISKKTAGQLMTYYSIDLSSYCTAPYSNCRERGVHKQMSFIY